MPYTKFICLSLEDAKLQIKKVFDALPLAERGFATANLARICAETLVALTEHHRSHAALPESLGEGTIRIKACPQCGDTGRWKYYDGCLGYESLVCAKCGLDVNDIKIVVNYKQEVVEC